MRFRNRYTDGFYKKMLNSEFLEVSIFLYLPVSSRRQPAEINATQGDMQQTETDATRSGGDCLAIVWLTPCHGEAFATQDELPTGATRQEVLS